MDILFNSQTPEWEWLSNFHPCPIERKGVVWPSAEHLYQAGKTLVPEEIGWVHEAPSAVEAKKRGNQVTLRADWETAKHDVMAKTLRWKFTQHRTLELLLRGTHPHVLIHQAPWDACWGNGGDGRGQNRQGRMLMELRAELCEQEERPAVAVIGSRGFTDRERLCQELDAARVKWGDFILASGGARGADGLGEAWARARGLETVIFPADWDRFGKRAGYIRNHLIVTVAQIVVAYWDGESRGTQHSLEPAEKLGRQVWIRSF